MEGRKEIVDELMKKERKKRGIPVLKTVIEVEEEQPPHKKIEEPIWWA